MNSYERFMAALRREEPDMLPIMDLDIDVGVRNKIMPGVTFLEFYEKIELDAINIWEDPYDWEEVRPGVMRDHFGILRDFRDLKGAGFPFPLEPLMKNDQDPYDFLERYSLPDPTDPKRFAPLRAAVERFKGKKAILFTVWVPFLYPSFIRGFENYLMDFKLNPDFVKGLSKKITDYYIEQAKCAIEIGADVIVDADDYCGKRGPFMSIPHFKEFVTPGLRALSKAIKEYNVPFIKHADGNVWPLMDILINDVGIDAFHPSQPDANMDIAEVKKIYGDRIAVIGNIECTKLLPFGTPEEVREATKECIKSTSPGGGHILSSSNSIHADIPHTNLVAMIEAAREFGKYPIK